MELRQLRYFVAVAEELHFHRAARRVNVAQPALSNQIRALEEQLDARLFHRTNRKVELTNAGRVLVEQARQILGLVERAQHTTRRAMLGEIGHLAIGLSPTADLVVLPRLLPAFRKRYPEIELSLYSLPAKDLIVAINDGRLQTGIVRLPVDDKRLVVERLMREPLIAVLPKRHKLAGRKHVSVKELGGEPHVLFPRRFAPNYYDIIVTLYRRAGTSLKIVQEADTIQTTLGLVAAELGVSIQPASVVQLGRRGVVYRPLSGPTPSVEIGAAYRPEDRSETLQSFLRIARQTNWNIGQPIR